MGDSSVSNADQRMQRLRHAEDELTQLELKAGITSDAAEKAWGLAFIPYGVMGDEIEEFTSEQNNTLYYDNEHDERARRVRDLYFSISGTEVRKQLIAKVLEIDDIRDRSAREELKEARQGLRDAERKVDDLNWGGAGTFGVACVAFGYWLANVVGAIAGAVGGIFLGLRMLSESRKSRRGVVADAADSLASAEESLRELISRPRFFTAMEAETGQKDNDYHVDAFGRRIREFHQSNASQH